MRAIEDDAIAAHVAEQAALEEEIEEDEEDEEEGADNVDLAAPKKKTKKKCGRPPVYSYPWPEGRRAEEGPPAFITHAAYAAAADAAVAAGKKNATAQKVAAAQYGVNFDTCLRLLPYFDVVRCFAMDKLHDIDLGPIKGAFQQTFGRANQTEKTGSANAKLTIRLPTSVGALVSARLLTLQPSLPSEHSVRLRAPHMYHQFYKGAPRL